MTEHNYGAWMVAWWNEQDPSPRHMVIDLLPLNDQANAEGWTVEKMSSRVQGFVEAVQLLVTNYNVTPRDTPMTQEEFMELQSELQSEVRQKAEELDSK